MVSLGCPKNQVDSEAMLGNLVDAGYNLESAAENADVVVVNTCGFIESAKEESINTILEMAEHTRDSDKTLVVAGCLVQRYHEELVAGLPEVDVFLGSANFGDIVSAVEPGQQVDSTEQDKRRMLPVIRVDDNPTSIVEYDTPRIVTGRAHSVYLKIAEGCDRPCGFCIIPKLRGSQRSRSIPSIVTEATNLVAHGAREINLIAQDLTRYGVDRDDDVRLVHVLRALNDVDGIDWIRLHYTYPSAFSDDLVDGIATLDKVVPYIDVPLQHIDDRMLKIMRRGHSARVTHDLLERLRSRIDNLVLRSTFIVGHPGEDDEAFNQLAKFIEQEALDHVGAFTYSQEPGTHSATLEQDVPAAVALERQSALMEIQKQVSRRKLAERRGREIEVLVDGVSPDSDLVMSGRFYGQAPGVDGLVYLSGETCQVGELRTAVVTDSSDYDLVAEVV